MSRDYTFGNIAHVNIIEWLESDEGRDWSRRHFRHINSSAQFHRRAPGEIFEPDMHPVVFGSLEPPEATNELGDDAWHGAWLCEFSQPVIEYHGSEIIEYVGDLSGGSGP